MRFDGWGLVRASNTQPMLAMRCEARTNELLAQITGVFKKKLCKYPVVKFSDADFEVAK